MSSPLFTLFEDAKMVVDGGPLGTGVKQETGKEVKFTSAALKTNLRTQSFLGTHMQPFCLPQSAPGRLHPTPVDSLKPPLSAVVV